MGAENNTQTDKPRFVGEWVRLGELVSIKTGKLDANAADEDGIYPFFTCAENTLRINTAAYDCECVLVAGNGDLNVKYYNGKFNAYQRTYIIEVLDRRVLDPFYLYQFLKSYVQTLREQSIGGVIKYIKLCNLKDALIPLPDVQIQQNIVGEFEKMDLVLEKQSDLSSHLDALVKSRFVELINLGNASHRSVRDCCIYVSRGKSPNYADESDVLVVNQACIRQQGLDLSKAKRQIREKIGRARVLQPGDVLLNSTGTGTLGRTCVVPDVANTLIADSHVTIMTPDETIMLPAWLNCLMSLPNTQANLYRECVSGSTNQIELSKTKLLEFSIPVVNLALQQEFAALAQRVDKLRFAIQEQIKKLETLKASLMQEYFG